MSGLGKSGHVGRKTAATFASLGVPAFFSTRLRCPRGPRHGLREDLGYFLSNSGETRELIDIIPYFKRLGAPIIAVTGNSSSTLAREADVVLNCHVESEADPLGLAPTSSTTLQMALGDAVAGMATLLLGLGKEDFALFHPGGLLGKKLLLRVRDLMGTGDKLTVKGVSTGQGRALRCQQNTARLRSSMTAANLWVCLPAVTRRFIVEGVQGLDLPVHLGMTRPRGHFSRQTCR